MAKDPERTGRHARWLIGGIGIYGQTQQVIIAPAKTGNHILLIVGNDSAHFTPTQWAEMIADGQEALAQIRGDGP